MKRFLFTTLLLVACSQSTNQAPPNSDLEVRLVGEKDDMSIYNISDLKTKMQYFVVQVGNGCTMYPRIGYDMPEEKK